MIADVAVEASGKLPTSPSWAGAPPPAAVNLGSRECGKNARVRGWKINPVRIQKFTVLMKV